MSTTNTTQTIVPKNQAPAPAQTVSPPIAPTNTVESNNTTYRLPEDLTMQRVCKMAILEDKPIMFDYWTNSLDKKALIGVRDNNEKLLIKSADEYTSPISKIYKAGKEYIIITENSIYIVANDIPTRKIS
jgi:hypothetical protein